MADPSVLRRGALLAAGLVLVLTGCGDDDGDAGPPASTTTTTTTLDTGAFCAEMERLDVETPESYVGSDEHVADVEALTEVAPGEIRPAVERYGDFLASGQVTDDPDSKQTDSWPEDVRADIAAIQDYAAAHC